MSFFIEHEELKDVLDLVLFAHNAQHLDRLPQGLILPGAKDLGLHIRAGLVLFVFGDSEDVVAILLIKPVENLFGFVLVDVADILQKLRLIVAFELLDRFDDLFVRQSLDDVFEHMIGHLERRIGQILGFEFF